MRRSQTRATTAIAALAIVVTTSSCLPPIEAEGSVDVQDVPDTTATSTTTTSTTTTTTTTTLAPTTTAATTTTTTTTADIPDDVAGGTEDGSVVIDLDYVIDGDTIVVADGSRVRMIGIDTPERDECGFAEARDHLIALIGAGPVRLVPGARSDADRYGRLLRYVEVGEIDTNYEMIASGHAIARYDGFDGYGRHPRQDQYRATDAAVAPAVVCAPLG